MDNCYFLGLFCFFIVQLVIFKHVVQFFEGLINGVDLSEAEAEASLDFLLDGADEALISAFLVLLRAKGETYEEVSASLCAHT